MSGKLVVVLIIWILGVFYTLAKIIDFGVKKKNEKPMSAKKSAWDWRQLSNTFTSWNSAFLSHLISKE